MEKMKLIKDKKAVLGINTVKAFIIGILAIAVIAIAIIIVLSAISSDSIIDSIGTTIDGGEVVNESVAVLNHTVVDMSVSPFNKVDCEVTSVINATGFEALDPMNFTFASGCSIVLNTSLDTTSNYNGTAISVSYRYNYVDIPNIKNVTNDVSDGVVEFFSNSSTFFTLLAVVVIILIIAIVIIAVNRFGGNAEGSVGGGGQVSKNNEL